MCDENQSSDEILKKNKKKSFYIKKNCTFAALKFIIYKS